MIGNIHQSLLGMAVPLERLRSMPNNPRHGSVRAIMASYDKFGQLKPVVGQPSEDGTIWIASGNHQLEAARQLGWTHLAVTEMEGSDEEAIAFALIENRFNELGSIDKDLLQDHIVEVYDFAPEVFEAVGWDDFEIVSLGSEPDEGGIPTGQAGGWVPPVLQRPDLSAPPPSEPGVPDADERDLVISGVGGATSQAPDAKRAAAQYTLMFDDADQMGRWWGFIRFLRSSPVYEGDTIAERLMQFIDAHSDY